MHDKAVSGKNIKEKGKAACCFYLERLQKDWIKYGTSGIYLSQWLPCLNGFRAKPPQFLSFWKESVDCFASRFDENRVEGMNSNTILAVRFGLCYDRCAMPSAVCRLPPLQK
jgi:hypothetical protein